LPHRLRSENRGAETIGAQETSNEGWGDARPSCFFMEPNGAAQSLIRSDKGGFEVIAAVATLAFPAH
jgi:hypothetical protein